MLSLILGASLFVSGCLSIDPTAGQNEPGPQAQRSAGGSGPAPAAWEVGNLWNYAVSGSMVSKPAFVAFGVVEEDPSSYLVATNSPEESARAVAGAGAPLVGRVDRDTLSPYVDGRPRDFLGLQRDAGASWEVVFLGSAFTMVKSDPMRIDGSAGHRAAGVAADGRSLVAEYNEDVGWFTTFEMRDKQEKVILGYRFIDRADSSSTTLESWQVLDAHRATAYQDSMGYAQWTSSGIADRLVVSVHVRDDQPVQRSGSTSSSSDGGLLGMAQDLLGGVLGTRTLSGSSGGSALATVLAPGDIRVFESSSMESGITVQTAVDQAGPWQVLASTGGPSVEIVVYQVAVTAYGTS